MIGWIDRGIRIVESAAGIAPAPHVAARIAGFAHGDPAAIREIAARLSPAQLRGMAMLPDPLPASPSVQRVAFAAVGTPAPAVRRVLMIAAHSVSDRLDVVLSAAAVDIAVVLSGPVTDLLRFRDGRFAFVDDRVRASMIAAAGPAERRDVHRSLARANVLFSESGLSAWHLTCADPRTAASTRSLLSLANQLLRAGDLHGAFDVALDLASRAEDELKGDALLIAARAAFACGCFEDADVLLREAAVSRSSRGGVSAAAIAEGVALARGEAIIAGSALGPLSASRLSRAVRAAAVGATDAHAAELAGQVFAVWEEDPEEADSMQAVAYLAAMEARPPWPWALVPGPVSPYVEAFVRGQNIGMQVQQGDTDGAMSILADALGRLPVASAVSARDASSIRALLRSRTEGLDALIAAFAPVTEGPDPIPSPVDAGQNSRASAAARVGAEPSTPTAIAGPLPALTSRQQQIVDLVVDGRKNHEIGATLGISPRTVEVHLTVILRKLGVRSRVELVALTLRSSPRPRWGSRP